MTMEVRKSKLVDGLGLFSTVNIKKDEVVFVLSGEILDHPVRESIHVGNGVHVVDSNGSFINHSFEPTIKICGYDVVANVDINVDDELTFNYNDSELEMACPFEVNGQKVVGNIILSE